MFFKSKHLNSINAGHYKHTAGCATEVMPVPASVRISMSQNIGAPCQPLVKKGDTVLVGQKIGDTDAFLHVPVHSSVSGKVTGIETQRNAMGGMDTLVCIETDGQQTMDPDIKPPVVTNHKEFVDAIKASGLVGLGGASFPTWLKFNPKDLDGVKVLIINGAECEPFITSDHRTMLEDAQNVIDGALAVMKYLEIEECYIGIEDNKQDAIDNFESLFAEQGIAGLHCLQRDFHRVCGTVSQRRYPACQKAHDGRRRFRVRAQEYRGSDRHRDPRCHRVLRRLPQTSEEDPDGRTHDGTRGLLRQNAYCQKQ